MKKLITICFLVSLVVWPAAAQAGFGISPPYVRSSKPIFAGSHYDQKITLLRSSAEEDLVAHITINAPEVESWITLDKGKVFDLPKGKLRVPMIVGVDVPEGAEIGNYKGHINIRISPKQQERTSGVSIALGARLEIDLTVTDQSFVEFNVRTSRIADIETLAPPWNWKIFSWFLYRLKVDLKIENEGNVKTAPTRVHLDVYDITEKKLLESSDSKPSGKVDPFQTQTVTTEFRTKLPPGQYWGKIKVYKDQDIVYSNNIAFTVLEHGELPSGTDLGWRPWILVASYFIALMIFIFIMIRIKFWRYLYIAYYFLTFPLRFSRKKLLKFKNYLKMRFWRWVHKKSSKYQALVEPEEDENDE